MAGRDKFLRSQKILRLATVAGDGTPHIVPVWYMFRAGRFYIGTNTRTKKARNLRGSDRVAFCVDEGVRSPDIFGVAGTGRARLILEGPAVKRIAKRILARYFESMADESARELLDDTDCIIEIIPVRYTGWKY